MFFKKNCLLKFGYAFFTSLLFLSSQSYARETVTIDAEDDWAPYSAKGLDGKPTGFAPELVKEIFNAVDMDVNFKLVSYAKCLRDVETQTETVGCFDTARSNANESKFLWPEEPLFIAKVFIWVSKDSPYQKLTFKDLIGKKVGMTNGYEYGSEFDTAVNITKDVSQSDESMLKKIVAKRMEYGVAYEYPANYVLKNLPELKQKVRSVGELSNLKLYVSFSKLNPNAKKYLELFNKGMSIVKKNGTYAKLYQKLDAENK